MKSMIKKIPMCDIQVKMIISSGIQGIEAITTCEQRYEKIENGTLIGKGQLLH